MNFSSPFQDTNSVLHTESNHIIIITAVNIVTFFAEDKFLTCHFPAKSDTENIKPAEKKNRFCDFYLLINDINTAE